MARWRLAAPHYINVPGTEWEYKEVDRSTGKQKRVVFPVPLHLDPDQPGDWNHRNGQFEGEIVVCHEGKGDAKDIVFVDKDGRPGDPTPDMVPLDEEAKRLTAAMAPKWNRPFEQTEGNSYAEGILDDLTKEIASLRSSQSTAAPMQGMNELLAAMSAMMKQNQELLARLAPLASEPEAPAKAVAGRRV